MFSAGILFGMWFPTAMKQPGVGLVGASGDAGGWYRNMMQSMHREEKGKRKVRKKVFLPVMRVMKMIKNYEESLL
jgi:hypothetical protein